MHIILSNSSNLPIYEQIKEQIKEQILAGDLKEDETWMSEFSALIQADKNCIRKIWRDREQKNCRYIARNDERLNYVRELWEKQR